MFKELYKILKRTFSTGFRVGLFLTAIAFILYKVDFPIFQAIELKAYDVHMKSRGVVEPGPEVVIVAIDEKSVDELGRWPWPRSVMASLVDKLNEYDAGVVAFDAIFSEVGDSSGMKVIRSIKSKVADTNPALKADLEAMEREADDDAAFARALERYGYAVLGYFFHTSFEDIEHNAEDLREEETTIAPSRFAIVRSMDGGDNQTEIIPWAAGYESNIPVLNDAVTSFGYFNIKPDDDGVIRKVPLITQMDDGIYPHLSLEAIRTYAGSPPLILNTEEVGINSIDIGPGNTVPTDIAGSVLVNFRGPKGTFPYISITDIVHGRVDRSEIEGRIVLVGATAIGIYDMRVTPFDGIFPGVEIHANVIDNILGDDFMKLSDWPVIYEIGLILFFGIFLSFVMPRLNAFYASIVTLAMAFGYYLANDYIFTHMNIWLTIVYPMLTIFIVSAGVSTFQFMKEESKKREIRDAFGHYVAPSLVDQITKQPEKLELGGVEKELTIFFSDIRGFTSISEGLEPHALVKLINDYLTPMTEIVLASGGTVDKYIGDAIMAFWGAPIDMEDHAEKGCETALDMMERLAELSVEWSREGLPVIDIGIGMCTGRATVGNMGSHTRFDYTVMGDTVNLGSRLEGINKLYGTHIIVARPTYMAAKTGFIFRELDCVRVKGKMVPIEIYELMGRSDATDFALLKAEFELGLSAYRARDWDKAESHFNGCLDIKPEDPPAEVFLKRVSALREDDPGEGWDGVFVLTTK